MKFKLDKVTVGNHQWQLVGDTTAPTVWVVDGRAVYEFEDRRAAFGFVADAYRRVADMRSMQPGQSYQLPMADGTMKMVQVQNQTPDGVQVIDPNSGQSMMIPHIQPGAEPQPAPQGGVAKPGAPGAPKQPGVQMGVSPENVTSFTLGKNDFQRVGKEPGKVPQDCEHSHHTHLLRKDPSDPEKFCPSCGTVYAASREGRGRGRFPGGFDTAPRRPGGPLQERAIEEPGIRKPLGPGLPSRKRPGGPLNERPIGASREDDEDDGEGSYSEQKDERDWHWRDKEKPKKTKREVFRAWKNQERIVRAFDLVASPPMPGQQAMPSADVANETVKMDEKPPSEFAEEPESPSLTAKPDPNAKRKLTPHEIIEEAENLIRNALAKGVTIGAADLSDYMMQNYQNAPDELLKGITLAWQKVQYEEGFEDQQGDQNTPQGEGFGPKAPTTPEEAAQMAPKNGPIQTRRLM